MAHSAAAQAARQNEVMSVCPSGLSRQRLGVEVAIIFQNILQPSKK